MSHWTGLEKIATCLTLKSFGESSQKTIEKLFYASQSSLFIPSTFSVVNGCSYALSEKDKEFIQARLKISKDPAEILQGKFSNSYFDSSSTFLLKSITKTGRYKTHEILDG